MTVHIQIAKSEDERAAAFRLRYEVYVEELGRKQTHANHRERSIREPLDDHGALFIAQEGSRVVGTLRVNYARLGGLGGYPALYEMDALGPESMARASITTKLCVALSHRGSPLAYRLAVAGYRSLLQARIEHDFIDVHPPRIPFFERLGYRVHLPHAHHPEYGSVVVMLLHVRDRPQLGRVRSPFLRHLARETFHDAHSTGNARLPERSFSWGDLA